MRRLLQSLFFFLLLTNICFGQWVPQNSVTTQHLYDVQFIDANTGWASGGGGIILKTTNGGTDWFSQTSGTTSDLSSVHFIDTNTGWAVGNGGIIKKTTNGGTEWYSQTSGTTSDLSSVHFTDSNTGWAVGGDAEYPKGIILKTTNSGNAWMVQLDSVALKLNDVCFINNNNIGFAVGGSSDHNLKKFNDPHNIFKTADGGVNWNGEVFQVEAISGISFLDTLNGLLVANEPLHKMFGSIWITTDGGLNWISKVNELYAFSSVIFANENYAYAVGDHKISFTSDGGFNWTGLYDFTNNLQSVCFIDSITGWVVGDNGTILHTTNGGVTFIDNEPTQPTEFILEQNYPNPFNPSTKIIWQSPVGSYQTIKVFDVLGNEIATLVDEYKPAGKYEVEFNIYSDEGRNLSSGVYLYQLRAGEFIQTRKMILLR